MDEWIDALTLQQIRPSTLSPHFEMDDICVYFWSVDGSRIERELGFTYLYQGMSAEALREQVEEYKSMGIWPN